MRQRLDKRSFVLYVALVILSSLFTESRGAPPKPANAMQDQLKIPHPWLPDAGDGTYRNPIICADYSDPDVIRDGDDFYLVASSFDSTPGLPILHSRDLVNWTIVNHAVKNLPDPRGVFDKPRPGEGVWRRRFASMTESSGSSFRCRMKEFTSRLRPIRRRSGRRLGCWWKARG